LIYVLDDFYGTVPVYFTIPYTGNLTMLVCVSLIFNAFLRRGKVECSVFVKINRFKGLFFVDVPFYQGRSGR
jgi:hypothetical protein